MSRLNAIISLVAVAVVAFLIGYVVGSSTTEEGGTISPEKAAKLPTVAKGVEMAPAKGAEHAKVTILEFSDFQ